MVISQNEIIENGLRMVESNHYHELGRKMEALQEYRIAVQYYEQAIRLNRENKPAIEGIRRLVEKIEDPTLRRVLMKTRLS